MIKDAVENKYSFCIFLLKELSYKTLNKVSKQLAECSSKF